MAAEKDPVGPEELPWSTLLRWIREEGHPFTGRGVAALARGGTAWLILWQLAGAAAAALVAGWAVAWAWVPEVEQALREMPRTAEIRDGRLLWPEPTPRSLAESPGLAFRVDPQGGPNPGDGADVQVAILPDRIRFDGVLGHLDLRYPPTLSTDLGRIEAGARWNAWRPFAVAGIALAAGLLLLPCWWALAALYAVPVAAAGWVFRKGISLADGWRLSGGALLAGNAVALAGIVGYAGGLYRLPGLALSQALHLLVGWMWILWGWFHCRRPAPPDEADAARPGKARPKPRRKRGANPFAG